MRTELRAVNHTSSIIGNVAKSIISFKRMMVPKAIRNMNDCYLIGFLYSPFEFQFIHH